MIITTSVVLHPWYHQWQVLSLSHGVSMIYTTNKCGYVLMFFFLLCIILARTLMSVQEWWTGGKLLPSFTVMFVHLLTFSFETPIRAHICTHTQVFSRLCAPSIQAHFALTSEQTCLFQLFALGRWEETKAHSLIYIFLSHEGRIMHWEGLAGVSYKDKTCRQGWLCRRLWMNHLSGAICFRSPLSCTQSWNNYRTLFSRMMVLKLNFSQMAGDSETFQMSSNLFIFLTE